VIELDPNLTYLFLNPTLNATLNATLYQPAQSGLNEWLKAPSILGIGQLLAAVALAILTYKLCRSTNAYAKQVEEQTIIMNEKQKQDISVLRYHRLQDEMDKLIAPLYFAAQTVDVDKNKMGLFRLILPSSRYDAQNKNDSEFWDRIRPNIYLSRSKNLAEKLELQFTLSDELHTTPDTTTRRDYNNNVKEIIKELQEIYPRLHKQITEVEEDLEIDKVFLSGQGTVTESGKEWLKAMSKPSWKFWK
jgi:hypothetical protein